MKVFIGTCEIAGYAHDLEKGFKSLKYDVKSWFKSPHSFVYDKNKQKNYFKIFDLLAKIRKYGVLGRVLAFCLYRFLDMMTFIYFFYFFLTRDVFIFIFGSSFFPDNRDLPILKIFNKKIIVIFCGSDTRCDIIDGTYDPEKISEESINRKIKMIRRWEKYADHIIVNPLSSQMHIRNAINWFAIGIPYKNTNYKQQSRHNETNKNNKFTILHAPSQMKVKGTYKIRKVIKELKTELKDEVGIEIEYIEFSDVPNEVVIDTIQKCDLVMDQLYSDVPLARLAAESAFFGKASVVGTYGKEYIEKYFNYPEQISFLINPDNLHEELKSIITNPEKIKVIGDNAKKFVKGECNPKKVAEKFILLIENNYPKSWDFDPREVNYWMGCGISKSDLIIFLQNAKIDLDKINLPKNSKLIRNLKLIKNKNINKKHDSII